MNLAVVLKYEAKSREVFENSQIKITTDGERHMGAVVDSNEFRDMYITEKVQKWVADIEELSIAKDEPQSALASFTKAIPHRWTFV